jgi:hypothetical protein
MTEGEYDLPIGKHKIEIEQSGYDSKSDNVNIQTNQTVNCSGVLNRKSNMSALWRSMLIPGWGQGYQEKGFQKWLYPLLFFGGLGGSYLGIQNYNDSANNYQDIRDQYLKAFDSADIEELRNKMDEAYEDVESDKQMRNRMFIFTGAVWLWNVIDVFLLPTGYTNTFRLSSINKENAYGVTIGLTF